MQALLCHAASYQSVPEEREKDDNRDWDAEQPKQNSSTHCNVLLMLIGGVRTRSFHVPSRNEPPSTAARLAANAPNNMAAVSQKDSFAAPFRALSAAVFASAIMSLTRFGPVFPPVNAGAGKRFRSSKKTVALAFGHHFDSPLGVTRMMTRCGEFGCWRKSGLKREGI
jgi:hypothetical protein